MPKSPSAATKSAAKPKVIVVLGPTASGKTKLAIRLARRCNGEIIAADSRQVYRGLDIGSGKDRQDYGRILHHLMDVADPRKQFTVADYQRLANRAIVDILKRGKLPIICGGTGLYISALVDGYELPASRITKHETVAIQKRLTKLSLPGLLAQLKRVDPVTFRTIDRQNRRRVERALEIYYQTGKRKSVQLRRQAPAYDFLLLGVQPPAPAHRKALGRRLLAWLRQGLLAEVRRLHRNGVSWKRLDDFGLVYRWAGQYAQAKIDRAAFMAGLERDLWQFSRRQMTWFRRDQRIHWITSPVQAERLTAAFLASKHS